MSDVKKKSRKATIAGALAAGGVILGGVAALIDGNPATAFDAQAIIAAVGTILAAFGVAWLGKGAATTDAVEKDEE